VNPENNAVSNLVGYQIDELAGWFASGRDAWGRALGADMRGEDTASLDALIEILGTPMRHHGGSN